METTRVFVGGLPPTLSEDEFRTHFSKRHAATDVNFMPKRRIGFVGYKTPEDAQAAIKYFNKSFLRMSRLRVTPAYDIDDECSQQHPDRKRKRSVDRPRNTDLAKADVEDNEVISKPSRALSQDAQAPPPPQRAPSDPNTHEQGPSNRVQAHTVDDAQDAVKSSTDTDWMRSRTSRLLGLVEDERSEKDREVKLTSSDANLQDGEETAPKDKHALNVDSQQSTLITNSTTTVKEPQQQPEPTRRLFLRNLAYSVSEEDLERLLAPYGALTEVQVPNDFKSGGSKGFAFAEFESESTAQRALAELDGRTFQGRLLHLLPAAARRELKLDEFAIAQLPVKKRKLVEKRQSATSSAFNWNSMFMNADAVLSSTAARLGVPKSEVFDPTSSDAAVKQAQAETNTIQSTKKYFKDNGVNLDSFSSNKRSGHALLVKNFKYDTSPEDLKQLFAEHGELTVVRILMPPTGTIAIVEFGNEVQAASALRSFAYRNLKDSVLFLEQAPKDVFAQRQPEGNEDGIRIKKDPKKVENPGDEAAETDTSTIFVRNLNFSTTTQRLWEEFKSLNGIRSALVKTRPDPKNQGKTLSMGFGFLEFRSHDYAKAALKAMNGHVLEGHELQLKASHKGNDAAADRKHDDIVKRQSDRSSKVVIKNLPFEASKKDVRNLFKSYGQLRALRMPKKLNNSSRGYAFAQFNTPKEAENALNALGSTHLLGRRLVLRYAADESEDPEEQIAEIQRKVGKQREAISMQNLTAAQRRKLNLDESNNEADGS